MRSLLAARIAILVVGFVVWAYGVRYDDNRIRLVGIGLFAVAVLLRFARRRSE